MIRREFIKTVSLIPVLSNLDLKTNNIDSVVPPIVFNTKKFFGNSFKENKKIISDYLKKTNNGNKLSEILRSIYLSSDKERSYTYLIINKLGYLWYWYRANDKEDFIIKHFDNLKW